MYAQLSLQIHHSLAGFQIRQLMSRQVSPSQITGNVSFLRQGSSYIMPVPQAVAPLEILLPSSLPDALLRWSLGTHTHFSVFGFCSWTSLHGKEQFESLSLQICKFSQLITAFLRACNFGSCGVFSYLPSSSGTNFGLKHVSGGLSLLSPSVTAPFFLNSAHAIWAEKKSPSPCQSKHMPMYLLK